MGIHVLPKEIAEKIAAGEVVERPASIVKELVENSIDALATRITVEFKNGGTTFLRVTDNGKGIPSKDVATAFLRHATSKIDTVEDLDQIRTMGFRGEALASIAAVCKVDLLTRSEKEEFGTNYTIEGLEEKANDPAGCPVGTTIVIRDIFFNTPARMKFLRKDIAEGNAISSILEKLALAHPDISFSLIRDGRETLFTPGNNNLHTAICAVLGHQFSNGLIPVSYNNNGISIRGFISKPEASKATRAYQHFFVNDRYVKYAPSFIAVTDAYKHSIMSGKFPACVLFIDISPLQVDVNVHPAKTEVKFVSDKAIYESLFFAAKSSLEAAVAPKEIEFPQKPNIVKVCEGAHTQIPVIQESLPSFSNTPKKSTIEELHHGNTISLMKEPNKTVGLSPSISSYKSNDMLLHQTAKKLSKDEPQEDKISTINSEKQSIPIDSQEENNSVKYDVASTQKEEKHVNNNVISYRLVGEVFKTYLIIEVDETLLLIDKHAAHERYLYNKLKVSADTEDRQILLSPINVTLSKEQYTAVMERMDSLTRLGFLVEDFGDGSLAVREIPMYLDKSDIVYTIEEIADSFSKNRNGDSTKQLDDLLHNIACRAAVKGGDFTREKEMNEIIQIVLLDKDVNYCPHGRPVAIRLTKKQVEKQFGRLV